MVAGFKQREQSVERAGFERQWHRADVLAS
jgi:hypothetical protein